jgi:hypothetical protein
MGAKNVAAAYLKFAGQVPSTSLVCLVYMALVSMDRDESPWYGEGHAALAEHALGRPAPITRADIKAVERAITPLLAVKALVADRRAAKRIDGGNTVRYRLQLDVGPDVPRKTGEVKQDIDHQRPPENGPHVPRKTGARPPENGRTSPGKRGTKETRGVQEEREEENLGRFADPSPSRARDPSEQPEKRPESIPEPACPQDGCVRGFIVTDGKMEYCPRCKERNQQ